MLPSPISHAPTTSVLRPATGLLRRCNAVLGKSDSGNPFSCPLLYKQGVPLRDGALVGCRPTGIVSQQLVF